MKFGKSTALGLLIALTPIGCGGEGMHEEESALPTAPLPERLSSIDRDLSVGSSGDDVQAVQEYLHEYGYFPNEALAQQHPTWRPVIASSPETWGVYDEHTEEAVRQLQLRTRLEETGIVDAATREILRMQRCAYPESAPADPSEKFAITPVSPWSKRTLTWRLQNTDDGIPLADARAAIRGAFASWAAETSLTFVETTGAADIEMHFEIFNTDPNVNSTPLASTIAPPDGNVRFDSDDDWSAVTPAPTNRWDLQTIALHEIGHSLGLAHSSLDLATMYFGARMGANRTLRTDDKVAISSLYDVWQLMPGCAIDIGVSGNLGGVWVIGCDEQPGGYGIWQWNATASTWVRADGGAWRIAVSGNGVPWVVNSWGGIFRRTSGSATSGFWEYMPGCAWDIGVAAVGQHVWIAGCDGRPFKWDNVSAWIPSDGGDFDNIAVGSGGVPWGVNTFTGQIYRRQSNSPLTGTWELMPGSGFDVGIAASNYPWITGAPGEFFAGGFSIYVWNEQAAAGTAPSKREWRLQAGRGLYISVESDGDPWIVDTLGRIFKREK